jgi:hypothetical protein
VGQVPAIKPGLWQFESDRSVDGRKAPDMNERLKTLPPAARQRMEALMKQHGIDTGGGGTRICMTRESLDQGRWHETSPRCRVDFGARSASAWKWRSVCTQPQSTSEGEAIFHSPESYTIASSTTVMLKGQSRTSTNIVRMKWTGADCGDVKPLQIKPRS